MMMIKYILFGIERRNGKEKLLAYVLRNGNFRLEEGEKNENVSQEHKALKIVGLGVCERKPLFSSRLSEGDHNVKDTRGDIVNGDDREDHSEDVEQIKDGSKKVSACEKNWQSSMRAWITLEHKLGVQRGIGTETYLSQYPS